MEGGMLRIREVADLLDVSTDILRRWDKDGKLVSIKTIGGHRRYRKSDIEERFGVLVIDKRPNFENAIVKIPIENPLSEPSPLTNYFDGLMLSDLSISAEQIKFGSKSKQFSEYTKSILEIETGVSFCNIYESKHILKTQPGKEYVSFNFSSRIDDFVRLQRKRWYPMGKKRIPYDLVITGESLLTWFLGDGTLSHSNQDNSTTLRLYTYAYSYDEVEFLQGQLESLGLHFNINEDKWHYDGSEDKGYFLICQAKDMWRFYEIIGFGSPFEDYGYKFSIPIEYAYYGDDWLTVYDMEKEFGISFRNFTQWANKELIPSVLGKKKMRYFHRDDLPDIKKFCSTRKRVKK